jgi:hypothetical protein
VPDLLPDPAWVFYMSTVQTIDEKLSRDQRAVFGKIEIYRISPQPELTSPAAAH